MLWPRYWGRNPKSTTCPAPNLTHKRRPAGHPFRMQHPPREQYPLGVGRIATDDAHRTRVEHLEGRAAFVPGHALRRQIARDGIARIELEPEDRARSVEFVVRHAL